MRFGSGPTCEVRILVSVYNRLMQWYVSETVEPVTTWHEVTREDKGRRMIRPDIEENTLIRVVSFGDVE
jgi:hypothetical protein